MRLGGCYAPGMCKGISFERSAADRERLAAVEAGRSSPQKHVWRAASTESWGTAEIMRRAGVSPCIWCWRARYLQAEVDDLLHDQTRPSRIQRLAGKLAEPMIARTLEPPPGETTHRTMRAMAAATAWPSAVCRSSGTPIRCTVRKDRPVTLTIISPAQWVASPQVSTTTRRTTAFGVGGLTDLAPWL